MAEVDLKEILTRARVAWELHAALLEVGFREDQALFLLPSMLHTILPFTLPIPKPPED
jgi:hypothetical protein